jgi:uncharacterized membrane protein
LLIAAILAWLHIISAIGWLGGGIMFAFVVGPALAKLSPPSSGEFLVKVVPRVVLFFQISAGTTILFGTLLLYNILPTVDFGTMSNLKPYGLEITIGLSIGFIAFLISEFVAVPIQLKAIKMIKGMQAAGQHQPPAEFPKTLKRAADTATLTVVLLILASVFMVAAGFY